MNEGRIFVEIFQMSYNIKFNRTKRTGCPNWFDMIIQCVWTKRFCSLDNIFNEFLRCRLFSFMKFWIQMSDSISPKKFFQLNSGASTQSHNFYMVKWLKNLISVGIVSRKHLFMSPTDWAGLLMGDDIETSWSTGSDYWAAIHWLSKNQNKWP